MPSHSPASSRRPISRKSARSRAKEPTGGAPNPERLAAARALLHFLHGGELCQAPPGLALAEQRRLYGHLLRGTVRHLRLLQALLERLARRPLEKLDPAVRAAALLGLYALHFTEQPAHAAVFETVNLLPALGRPHAKGLVNAVLRSALRERLAGLPLVPPGTPLGVATSHPDWLLERWTRRYGAATTAALCETNNRFDVTSVRVQTARIAVPALLERLAREGVAAAVHPLWPEAILTAQLGALLESPSFAEGLLYVQDVSAQILCAWLAPLLTGPVLDVCTAPGGKLTHLRALLPPQAWLVGMDVQPARLRRVRENLRRLCLPGVPLLAGDGRRPPFAPAGPGGGWQALLLDVPCSATGMIRKYPELRWRRTPEHLLRSLPAQRELLDAAAPLLRPGGLLVYCTCSLEPEENEEQVRAFLARQPRFARLSLAQVPPPAGLREPQGLLNPEGDLLMLPDAQRMGLYAALLRREG